jgi:hypothetical protein
MKLIPLTKGYFAKVDDSDYKYLSQWKWHYNCGYAERKVSKNGKQTHVLMHRVISGFHFVDHRNGDKLDNQRKNLRKANHSTNAMNMKKHRGVSKYKGVSNDRGYWRVQIWKNKKKAFTANAPTELWAAMIYDLNAPLLFGPFARLNFASINSGEPTASL